MREAANTSREAAKKEKPLVTLDLNLTFIRRHQGQDLTLGLGLVDIFKNTQISMIG